MVVRSDDGNDNYYDEINSNNNYHEINSCYDGLDGEDDGNDQYYDDIQSDGSLHSSTLPSSSTTPKQSSSSSTPATETRMAKAWANMTKLEKSHSLRRVKALKQIQRCRLKINKQNTIINDLHAAMKNAMENSVVPMKSREDQTSYLKKHFGDSVDFNLLDDVELKTKYASAYIFRQSCPKKIQMSKFRKDYAIKYLE